ncbi:putative ferric-chelate reductase (Fre2) [Teratosphaeria destructans]|uniref:Ferric-chelate reductase (Fre2) n=1 Tax=Teratosphaeria destructans TaxID=418781 RepID=A0A9W7SU89_9PEZI|nr:putative ferric-chelate reductase (Fre2) [Teratosphaeria destructans]
MHRHIGPLLAILWLCASPVRTMISAGRPGHGFVGYGITMFKPGCAYACHDSIKNPLRCSAADDSMPGMTMWTTPPECYATDDAYLQTLAYCIFTRCEDVEVWRLERYWTMNVAGRHIHQPSPKYTYRDALAKIDRPPNSTTPDDEVLAAVSLVDEEAYDANLNTLRVFEEMEVRQDEYGLVLLLTGSILPIALSLLRFLPLPRPLVSRFAATFVYAPLFGSWGARLPFSVPTRGQAFMIAYFLALNIVLCAVGYDTTWPMTWFTWRGEQIPVYLSDRTGVFSAANMALLTLYAGRNNILLWLTNWSHSTFLLLHRWIAIIAVLEACLHSAIYLNLYLDPRHGERHSSESKLPYWYWGIISTLSMTLLLPLSVAQLRRRVYEVFLASHFALALLAYVAYYYHIIRRYDRQWGYETWIYIAFAIWAFDRLIRVMKLSSNGIKRGQITVIDDDYVRLDVPGVASAGGHAYLYFPTLSWRIWENHPFSVTGGFLPQASGAAARSPSEVPPTYVTSATKSMADKESTDDSPDRSGDSSSAQMDPSAPTDIGLTFFIRTGSGITSRLRHRVTLPVLVEGPYQASHYAGEIATYPNILCIAGGVGITAVVSVLASHARGRRKLYWSVRSGTGLVHALHDSLKDLRMAGVGIEVVEGGRIELEAVIAGELDAGASTTGGTAILVSGPRGMAEEARRVVSRVASRGEDGGRRLP